MLSKRAAVLFQLEEGIVKVASAFFKREVIFQEGSVLVQKGSDFYFRRL